MPKVKLDAAFCRTVTCPPDKKKIDYYDETVNGFVLEVRKSGGATYYLRFHDKSGKLRQHKIAAYGDITFDKARKEAVRLRSEVTLGGDPAKKKAEAKAIPLYSELAQQHLDHAKAYLKSYDTVEMYMRLHILPRWGKHRLDDISTQAVAAWLAEKKNSGFAPATVEKIRVTMSRTLELGRKWRVPGTTHNPIHDVPRIRFDNASQRYITAAEVTRLMEAAEESLNPQLKSIISLLLLTGARVSELLNAQWKHIDLERKAWLIPTSKTVKHRYVPLSGQAIAVIEDLPKYKDCPWLIPNPETKKPFVSIKHGWQTTRKKAKLPGLRIHDLRHSAASFMINAGVDLYAVGRILGHADHKSTMRYSHLANDTLLAAVEKGAAKMEEEVHAG